MNSEQAVVLKALVRTRLFGPALIPAITAASLGCGSLPQAPAYPTETTRGQSGLAPPPGLDNDPPQPLTLYPGDIVTVTTVSAETNQIAGLVVDETGKVHIPLAGEVEIGGLGLGDAESRVEEALRAYDRFVRVTVTLTDPAGHRATVLGAVAKPGQVPVTPGTRLADLIAASGGPLVQIVGEGDFMSLADLDGARFYRKGQALPVSVRIALSGEPRHNVRVQPGDHLYIPPRLVNRVAVLGAVQNANAFPYREGLRLTEAIAMAGSTTIDGDEGDVRVVRGDLANPTVYSVSLHDIIDDDGHDVMLQPGDIVFVTDHWLADVGEVLSRLSPILSAGVTVGVTAVAASN